MSYLTLLLGLFLGSFLTVGLSNYCDAQTIVSKRINETNKLIPLKKITVGPDDQYNGSVDYSGKTLVFTRKSGLIAHLCTEDLQSQTTTTLLPMTADSEQAVIGPNGLVAFVYYRIQARGSICYRKLHGPEDSKISCLMTPPGEVSSPFWKSDTELGYLLKPSDRTTGTVFVHDIATGKVEIIASGDLGSPAMIPGGKYLFYSLSDTGDLESKRALVMKDLTDGTIRKIQFKLPGFSGFPAVSAGEKFLFFSHYLNDTNNDNIIDGNDNSVIFRIPIEKLSRGGIFFPEQLTSSESNCSLPKPHPSQRKDELFVTCALREHLDVYQLPLTGVIPTTWDENLLKSAHATSRTYEERILILNTIKYRFPQFDEVTLYDRILSNHLFSEDLAAAKYYLKKLEMVGDSKKRNFYELLYLLVTAIEKKKLQVDSEVVTPLFLEDLSKIEKKIVAISGYDRFKEILYGLLKTYIHKPNEAIKHLDRVKFTEPVFPIERYYYYNLARSIPAILNDKKKMLSIYHEMITASELSLESQIYYAFDLLKYLEPNSINDRLSALKTLKRDLKGAVLDLITAEEICLQLIESSSEGDKQKQYSLLDKLMSQSRNNYFLRKAIYIRAILNFSKAVEFTYLNFVATNWLRYTASQDTEFSYAREVYVHATLDEAYNYLAQKNYKFASDYFYGSLSLTDDLESHFGYIKTMALHSERKTIDLRYQNLSQREFISDNMKFVRALLLLIDQDPKDLKSTGYLNSALSDLESMKQDRDSSVRNLLMGYCYLEKLVRTVNGYDFDASLLEKAHRFLMLAYDAGYDHVRIRASALMNLGILHQRVQNHGLAVHFFSLREPVGFISTEEHISFGVLYARSLFYINQTEEAIAKIREIIKLPNIPQQYIIPIQERLAFYLQSSDQCTDAIGMYNKILPLVPSHAVDQTNLNLAKLNLGLGYCLVRLRNEADAKTVLNSALNYLEQIQPLPKGSDRLIDFQPNRLKVNAYGLLAQIGSNDERLNALEKRGKLLPLFTKLYDDGQALEIKNLIQRASLYNSKNISLAVSCMEQALNLAYELGQSGQYLNHAVYQAIVNYMAHHVLYEDSYPKAINPTLKLVVEGVSKAYLAQKQMPTVIKYQKVKVDLLWAKITKASGDALMERAKNSGVDNVKYSTELKELAKSLSVIN